MPWGEMVVIDTGPGTEPSAGFVQAIDLESAKRWTVAAMLRTRDTVAAGAITWALQLLAVQRAYEAIAAIYRACNMNWFADPIAAMIWHMWWGTYEPKDPDPSCIAITTGPLAVWTGRPWQPRMPASLSPSNPGGWAWRAAHPPVPPIFTERMKALWIKVKGPLPRERVEVVDPVRRQWFFDLARATENPVPGQPLPTPPAYLPPQQFVEQESWHPVLVAPAFLMYPSVPVVLDTSNPAAGLPSQKMDGVFTGAACATAEVPRNTQSWSWDCFRWDDAPFQTLRIVPPLKWAFEFAQIWADWLYSRGPQQMVMDARVNQILENLARAKEFAPDGEIEGFEETIFKTLTDNRALVHNSAKDRATLAAVGGTVCAAAALAGGAPGLFCAAAAAGLDALLGILPRAVGCDGFDDWGQLLPSALRAQIVYTSPPTFPPPAYPPDVTGPLPQWSEPAPVSISPLAVGPLPPTTTPPTTTPPVPAPPSTTPPTVGPDVVTKTTPATSSSSVIETVAAAGAVGGVLWGLAKLVGGK